jgi:hypothetical protein
MHRRTRMTIVTLYAHFDGEVFRPESQLPLEPNTRVLITVETEQDEEPGAVSFPADHAEP